MQGKFRKLVTAILSMLAVIGLSLGLSAPAQAASYHNLTDPNTTGCASGAYTIHSKNIYDYNGSVAGYVELRYSPTCNTNWARTTSYRGGSFNSFVTLTNDSSQSSQRGAAGPGQWWTLQLYAPGSTCVNYGGAIFEDDNRIYSAGWTTVC